MHLFICLILAIISVIQADVSHLTNTHHHHADGYHYEHQSENEIIPQQSLSGRNDFNPPAFLAQLKPTPQPVPEYIPPVQVPVQTNLQEDGYHYQQPSVPFPSPNQIIPEKTLSARNDFNPPAFLLQPKPTPQKPAPAPIPEYIPPTPEYIAPTPEYIPPTPEYIPPVTSNLQEDGYHYQQPAIPFPSPNQIIPEKTLSARNDFNPPAFLAQQKPEEPRPQEPVPEQPVAQIPEYVAPEPVNLQEDGYHYEQPSIPFEPQQSLSGRNDFNPPAFLLVKPEEPETPAPVPEEPVSEEPTPEAPAPEELAPAQPEPEEPVQVQPEPVEQIPEEFIQPAPTPVQTNLQDDGYHYAQPSIPFLQPEPAQQYLPVAEPEPVQPQPEISSYFGTGQPEPEPSYSLGPNGYNYRVPSRPFRF